MKLKLFFALVCLFCANEIFAQTHTTEIGLQTDNDSYLLQGSDRYYTDGIFFYYRHALKVKPGDTAKMANKVLGFEFGQKLYNPQAGSIAIGGLDDPAYIDRPFAAYLYVGATLNLLYKNESNLKLSAQIGVVGPAALGKQVQDYVHDNFGFYHPSGWEYQVDNSYQLNLGAEYNRLLARDSWIDLSLTSYANLGNGFTGAGVGPLVRAGDFNQLFNSVSTQSTATQSASSKLFHKNEVFFYYKPQLNFIAYDATVQGSLFGTHDPNSMEVTGTPKRVVLSNQFGLAFTTNRFTFDIAAIFHTKDVEKMVQAHQWGSITGLYRFK